MRITRLNTTSVAGHRLLLTLLVILFIAVQAFAAAHASGHPFHDTDDSCIVLSLAEKHTPVPALCVALPADNGQLPVAHLQHGPLQEDNQPHHYQTRAPPAIRHN